MRDEAGFSNQFVVFYDLAARASFHRRAAGNDVSFDIEKEVAHIAPAVMLDAKTLFAAARVKSLFGAPHFQLSHISAFVVGWACRGSRVAQQRNW
jgi:hypothetical protein